MAALVSPQSKQLILKVDVYSELRLRFLYTGSLGELHYLQVRTAHVIDENLIILRRLFSGGHGFIAYGRNSEIGCVLTSGVLRSSWT